MCYTSINRRRPHLLSGPLVYISYMYNVHTYIIFFNFMSRKRDILNWDVFSSAKLRRAESSARSKRTILLESRILVLRSKFQLLCLPDNGICFISKIYEFRKLLFGWYTFTRCNTKNFAVSLTGTHLITAVRRIVYSLSFIQNTQIRLCISKFTLICGHSRPLVW